jgi:hypothetical protein
MFPKYPDTTFKEKLHTAAKAIRTRVGNNSLVDLMFTALMLVFTPAIIWLF